MRLHSLLVILTVFPLFFCGSHGSGEPDYLQAGEEDSFLCQAKCLFNDTMTPACPTSCDNLKDDELIEKPFLDEVTLADNELVFRWQLASCADNCHRQFPNFVSVIRYSEDMQEWIYNIETGNWTFSIDLRTDCAKHFQVVLVNRSGGSPASNMRNLSEPFPVIEGNVTACVDPPIPAHPFSLSLSWQNVSGWPPSIYYYLEPSGDPQCREPRTDNLKHEVERKNITNGLVENIDGELARGNCNVTYQVKGSFGACYEIVPVTFKYAFVCDKIFGNGCPSKTPPCCSVDVKTISVTPYSQNMSAYVQWPRVESNPKVYGYIVQWGEPMQAQPFLTKFEPGTMQQMNISGVENSSVWLTGFNDVDIQYCVKVAVNMSEGIKLDMVEWQKFEFLALKTTMFPQSALPLRSTQPPEEFPTITFLILVPILLVVASAVFVRSLHVHRRRLAESRLSKRRLRRDEESMPNVYSITPAADSPDTLLPDRWEIPFERLEMGEILGKGQFGIVMKALIPGKLSTHYTSGSSLFRDSIKRYDVQVAVKMLHGDADEIQRQEFRREMKLMKDLGTHCNLVSLLGCCSTDTAPLCLIVEHCSHGDLLQYLRVNRRVVNENNNEKCEEIESDSLTPNDLLSFARQIARGMEYLSQKGFVHRDLAARNVMVAEDKTVKIGDFGLTRYVYDDNIYVHRRGGKLPIKWMSVEALYDQAFTTFNDVWSFGVLLFELVTLGASPYPGIHNKDIPGMLKRGYRIQRPENCSEVLYAIMIACWHPCAEERPTFTHLRNKLEALLEEDTPYLDLCQNYSHFPFFQISEDLESEEEGDTESGGDGVREPEARRNDIPMVSIEGSDDDKGMLSSPPGSLSTEEVFIEVESNQPMLDSEDRDQTSGSWGEANDIRLELQKRDSGLGSDYPYSSRHTNVEDVPLM